MNLVQLISALLLFVLSFKLSGASQGDKSPYYHNCINICRKEKCSHNVLYYKKGFEPRVSDHIAYSIKHGKYNSRILEDMFQWNCQDECKYKCMWKTTTAFWARKWATPQFHGKWPFLRLFGLQEPASVIFSALNLFVHYKMLQEFRRKVRNDSPLYKLWHAFAFICMNAWVFSMIFHTKDTPLTELLDYCFAYSMVLSSFCCMLIRVAYSKSKKLMGFIASSGLLFYLNHFIYLSYGMFDYSYNMKVNVITGVLGGVGWIFWCIFHIKKRPYGWKCIVFVLLAASTMVLEIYDFPPILWTFDAHSLWHLSSAPITILFYKFLIDDCVALRIETKGYHHEDGQSEEDKIKLL